MDEFQYPEWQIPVQEMILEFDREKLLEKAVRAEDLIFKRLRKLQLSGNGHTEREAINFALSIIRSIRHERLGFPEWK